MPSINPALRKEFAQLSKTANARIKSLKKGRYRSPAVEKLKESGIKKFGVKAQKLETEADFRKAIRQAKNFLSAETSTRKGLKKVTKEMMKNFNISKKGGEGLSSVTRKARKLFDLYDDLKEMQNQGQLKMGEKYEVIEMLSDLYADGVIDDNTSASEVASILNGMVAERREAFRRSQTNLNFQWNV